MIEAQLEPGDRLVELRQALAELLALTADTSTGLDNDAGRTSVNRLLRGGFISLVAIVLAVRLVSNSLMSASAGN